MDLNLRGGGELGMRAFSSSPTSLSSPPASSAAASNPASPSQLNRGRANIDMDEIVVDTAGGPRFGVMAPPQPPPPDVPLTAAGLPRKKPGRKPGSTVKPKVNADGTVEPPKAKRPRKPRDPNAPPVQRKRKAATQDVEASEPATGPSTPAGPSATAAQQPKASALLSMRMDVDSVPLGAASSSATNTPSHQPSQAKIPKREGIMSLLNDDPPPPPAPAAPTRMAFDPVRSTSSSYDPVRETMVTRDPYGTAGLTSPRASSYMPNRASASPSISSLVDPPAATKVVSPTAAHTTFPPTTQARFQESSSLPPSPSQSLRTEPPPAQQAAATTKTATAETKKSAPAQMPQPSSKTNAAASSTMAPPATMPTPSSKKIAAVQAQTRKDKKASSTSSSPKMGSLKNALPDVPPLPATSNDRSILDFGKAAPGEEKDTPSIVISIPLNSDGNKYINFMRLAEEKYGWDALHPRQAADRERKARIAAAAAALEKQQSGRDSAEEEEPDNSGSDEENSNVEMGGMGNNGGLTSGADAAAPEKPKRKKRNWREDEYDRGDDFVDDSEMLWEEQAAAVQDGFFVYSGPLVPEAPKPAVRYVCPGYNCQIALHSRQAMCRAMLTSPLHSDGPAKRGRGGRRGGGPGSRGGRGGAEGGRGRGGGPGSRGGTTTRKPRITKLEKQRMETEKAERENMAKAVASKTTGSGSSSSSNNNTTSSSNGGAYGLLSGLVSSSASVPPLSAGLGAGLLVKP